MYVLRSLSRSFAAAVTLLVGTSSILVAQRNGERELFSWSGQVDREVRIAMRDNDVWSRTLDKGMQGQDRSRVLGRLPRNDGYVSVRVLSGRGSVDVVQQPSASNDYTAIVRVRDNAGGSDSYRLAAYWVSNYADTRGPRMENRDRDDRYGRDDRGYGRDDRGYGRDDNNGRGYGRDRDGRYNNGSMHWTGSIDGTTEIRIRQRDVTYRTLSGARPRDVQTRLNGAPLNNGNQTVELRDTRGRGQVTVVQQPSRYNDYTAVIRVTDPQGGFGRYDFDVIWR